MNAATSRPGRTATRQSVVLASAIAAWVLASAVLYVASERGCSGDCHYLGVEDLQSAFAVAVGAVIVFNGGPALIAGLAFRCGRPRIGYVFLACTVMATVATLFTNAALTILTADWTGLTSTW